MCKSYTKARGILAGWLAGWLPAWLPGCLAGWLAGWMAGWLAGVTDWLAVGGWVAGVALIKFAGGLLTLLTVDLQSFFSCFFDHFLDHETINEK